MKRYTILALVMALCASLLVGCGCSGNVAVTTTPTTAPTTEATTVPTTEAPTTEATTAPSTEPATKPTAAPDTSPTDTTGHMHDGNGMIGGDDGAAGMPGGDGNMDADRGTVPDDSTRGARGRKFR